MRIHRSAHQRFFTTLGNAALRDSRLTFCARGILAHLLSQPDGKRDDIRTLAERTPEGRERIASAMRELERFGYLKRTKRRTSEGKIYTEVEVFETPDVPSSQAAPNAGFPASGRLAAGPGGDHPVNERGEEPTLPVTPDQDEASGREVADDEDTKASTDLLARVSRTEPKLSLGRLEALRLAPLVTEWRRRGASDLHVIGSLTAGLPRNGIHHPARFIESRLVAKMPAERRVPPTTIECDVCRAPVIGPGPCRPCQRLGPAEGRATADFGQVRARGAALARAALRGLSVDAMVPALS